MLGDLVLLYAPFDVLWLDSAGGSTAHLPLPARKALLAAAVGRLPPGRVGIELGVEHNPDKPYLDDPVPRDPAAVAAQPCRTRMLGRLEPLLADEPFMCGPTGAPVDQPACVRGYTAADIEAAYKGADERGEEGIVVKGSAAAWAPGEVRRTKTRAHFSIRFALSLSWWGTVCPWNPTQAGSVRHARCEEFFLLSLSFSLSLFHQRNGGWLKMKPDYEKAHEVDALVVGANLGKGHRGGFASEYIMALLDQAPPKRGADGQLPPRLPGEPLPHFASFVRVGTGFTMNERAAMDARLRPLLEDPPSGRRYPPWLRVAGSPGEAADAWMSDPTDPRTPVLVLKADVRVTRTQTYAVGMGLRHVRIARVHEHKTWADIPTARSFVAQIKEQRGLLGRSNTAAGRGPARPLRPPGGGASRGVVPAHLRPTAGLAPTSGGPLVGKTVHVINRLWGSYGSAAACQAAVAGLGGKWVAGLTPGMAVDFVLAADPATGRLGDSIGAALYAATIAGDKGNKGGGGGHPGRDVLDVSWLAECEAAAAGAGMDGAAPHLVAPAPRHYLHLARKGVGAATAAAAPRAPGDIAAEAHALPAPDRWGDPARQPSEPADMRAVLGRFMAGVALTRRDVLGEGCAQPDRVIAPGTPDADEAVRAGLALLAPAWPAGAAPLPDMGLRGVAAAAVCLVRPPAPSPPAWAPAKAHAVAHAVATAEIRADSLARRRAETALVRRGARVVGAGAAWGGGAATAAPLTHLVVVTPPGLTPEAWADVPNAVLEAAWAAGGAAGMARLRLGLALGGLVVVDEAWVGEAAGAAAAGGAPPLCHAFPGLPPAGSDAGGWDWEKWGVAPPVREVAVVGQIGPAGEAAAAPWPRGGGGARRRCRPAPAPRPPRARRRLSPPEATTATAAVGTMTSQAGATTVTAPPAEHMFSAQLEELAAEGGGSGSVQRHQHAPPPPPAAPLYGAAAAAATTAAGPGSGGGGGGGERHPMLDLMEDMARAGGSGEGAGAGAAPLPPVLGAAAGAGGGPPPPPPPPWQAALAAVSQQPPPPAAAPSPPPPPPRLPSSAYPDGYCATEGLPPGWTMADYQALPQAEMDRLMGMD